MDALPDSLRAAASQAERDPAELLAFLRWLRPNGPWVLDTCKTPGRMSAAFGPDREEALRGWVAALGERDTYALVGIPEDGVTGQPKKEQMRGSEVLWVDLDPRAGEDVTKERERMLALLTTARPAKLPPPSLIVDSGRGLWAFWRLAAPLHDAGLVERLNRAVALQFPGDFSDACHNINRVARAPGTINSKTRAVARVLWDLSAPTATYTLDQLPPPVEEEAQEGAAGEAARAAASALVGLTVVDAPRLSLDELERRNVPDRLRVVVARGDHPDGPPRPSRSEWLFDAACGLLRFGLTAEEVFGVITDTEHGISESVYRRKDGARVPNPSRYARRQVENAVKAVARDSADTASRGGPPQSGTAPEMEVNDKGVPHANQANIRTGLALLGARVSYDAFQDRCIVEGVPDIGPVLSDAAMTRLFLLMDERFRLRPSKHLFWMVVEDAARRASFHPVRDYLAGLAWDGQPRIDRWLTTYGAAEETPYSRAVGRLLLVAAVRRVRQPGCKFDEMVVLEGPQGANKSSALRVLAVNEDWFTDDLPLNVESKVVIERLAGRWIAEAAELKGMRSGAVEHLKSFLSRSVDRARMSYDRMVSEVPRQCVIVGTTNSEHYLRDGTGNRRFWPVRIEKMDLDALRRDRDQLWAEAAAAEAEGESVRLPENLWAAAAQEQEARRVEEPFAITLGAVLGDITGRLRAADVWQVLNIADGHRTQDHNARLGDAMRELGWARVKQRFGGSPEWCYVRGTETERLRRVVLHESGGRWRADFEDMHREAPF
jgi:hypothetical protein